MENVNHQLAYQFWETYFPELENTILTERKAIDIDFWNKLHMALGNSDSDTLWAIVLTNLPMQVEVIGMHRRIVTSAKHLWHSKQE